MNGAAGVKAVRVGRDAAHRVHGHRPADHARVALPGPVGPGLLDHHLLLEGGMSELGGDSADGCGGDARPLGDRSRRIGGIEAAAREDLEHRDRAPSVPERQGAVKGGSQRPRHHRQDLAALPVEGEGTAFAVAGEQPVLGRARGLDHQPGGVGVAAEIVEIDPARLEQLVAERHDEEAVGAGPDAQPLVGDGRVSRPYRVEGQDLGAVLLQLGEAELDGVAVVVLGHAEEDEVAGPLPVRLAELPEAAADRVHAGGRHVDRAEAAMRRVVAGAELAGEEAGQCLALVAAGEEGELLGIARADLAEPAGRQPERLLPLDLDQLVPASLADPLQRLPELGGQLLLHDAGRALGAEHAPVHRMGAVAFDVAETAVLEVHPDPAAAGAHVAGAADDLVGDDGRQRDLGFHGQSGAPMRRRWSEALARPTAEAHLATARADRQGRPELGAVERSTPLSSWNRRAVGRPRHWQRGADRRAGSTRRGGSGRRWPSRDPASHRRDGDSPRHRPSCGCRQPP